MKTYLELYHEWIIFFPYHGLCAAFDNEEILPFEDGFELLMPTKEDCKEYQTATWWYWGQSGDDFDKEGFNGFRQNIVLLLAALNEEL